MSSTILYSNFHRPIKTKNKKQANQKAELLTTVE